jgi:ubiquitin-conjugating enzyme E2 Q
VVHPPKQSLAPIVMADALSGDAGPFSVSFPLLAMQFALRHLVRCTEFCLVCHSKVSTDFEALKPYVCSNPLCLYQYMSLGFGPSIEYEIVSQPSVVDLLVSFCYSAGRSNKLETFPDGMDLKVPSATVYKVNYHRHKGEFQFDDDLARPALKEGDWIVITVEGYSNEEWHARITEVCYWPTVKIAQPIYNRINAPTQSAYIGAILPGATRQTVSHEEVPNPIAIPGETDIREVHFRVCDDSFDTLTTHQKSAHLVSMLNILPSVSEMRCWLQKNTNPGDEASLRKWRNRISPTALGILRWVIASNRSCIVPLEDCGDGATSGFLPVQNMGSEWKQFRFAMGAPDKEQRFVNSVRDAQKRLGLKRKSIFSSVSPMD